VPSELWEQVLAVRKKNESNTRLVRQALELLLEHREQF
jgi:hypothetical protein